MGGSGRRTASRPGLPFTNVRKKAAWALGEIGAAARAAAPALEAAATSDASPLVRSLAQAALGRLNR